jgi:hypothetical protein
VRSGVGSTFLEFGGRFEEDELVEDAVEARERKKEDMLEVLGAEEGARWILPMLDVETREARSSVAEMTFRKGVVSFFAHCPAMQESYIRPVAATVTIRLTSNRSKKLYNSAPLLFLSVPSPPFSSFFLPNLCEPA